MTTTKAGQAGTIPREVNPADIGWLAGIIDGEGSIYVNRNARGFLGHNIAIIGSDLLLMNKCVEIIRMFDDGLGLPTTYRLKKYKEGMFKSNKTMYEISIHRQGHIKNLLEALLPHLTEKKLKAAILLNFLQNHTRRKWYKENEIEEYLKFTPVETKRATPIYLR